MTVRASSSATRKLLTAIPHRKFVNIWQEIFSMKFYFWLQIFTFFRKTTETHIPATFLPGMIFASYYDQGGVEAQRSGPKVQGLVFR